MKIGNTLQIEHRNASNKKEIYKSRIIDLTHDQIFIDPPVNEKTRKTVFFQPDTVLKAMVLNENKVYRFTTSVIERRSGRLPMLVLSIPNEEAFSQIQRRNFVRMESNLDIAVHSSTDTFIPFSTITSDIGGGGVQVSLPADHLLSMGDSLQLYIVLPLQSGKRHYLKTEGEVVRIFTDKHTNKEKASFSFRQLSDKRREPIIRYCFEQELRLRKKKQRIKSDR